MFNGTLIDDLFAVVRKAEKSARPALPEEAHSREANAETVADLNGNQRDRRQAISEAE
jgi:hypothetical protein